MRRNPKIPAARENPLRDLVAERRQLEELTRSREQLERLQEDLPAIISEQVDQHMERLENRLVEEFRDLGQKAAEVSAQAITDQLSGRLDVLEQMSAIQARSIGKLRNSSHIAEQKVGAVVETIERTLSDSVPGGFRLEPVRTSIPAGTPATMPPHVEFVRDLVKSERRDLMESEGTDGVRYVYCPNCTSTKVRRAYRHGLWEEFLRLFFIAPFRCRACRHKFYRF